MYCRICMSHANPGYFGYCYNGFCGWRDETHIDVISTTGFGQHRDIWHKFETINKPQVKDRHMRQYLLIADRRRVRRHCNLPVLRLQGNMQLPKTSYASFDVERVCSIEQVLRFADAPNSDNTYVVDTQSRRHLEHYVEKRRYIIQENLVKENEKKAQRKAEIPQRKLDLGAIARQAAIAASHFYPHKVAPAADEVISNDTRSNNTV
ncbi:uncharacterized protein LTHEOB_9326 [Neofusicoccum parvum]|uniref:Uncharacterized protein LTHEOB_9326 n=1 Tax=Neofusicoccum parvum TaxID=310453 RepID=A0ACB5SP57_9PEZI|nr:uncharacterized protein LTHEOB_9326 [Neofusicoccum parvum]